MTWLDILLVVALVLIVLGLTRFLSTWRSFIDLDA
jgi:nitrogen fixation-related uncharacterized protein